LLIAGGSAFKLKLATPLSGCPVMQLVASAGKLPMLDSGSLPLVESGSFPQAESESFPLVESGYFPLAKTGRAPTGEDRIFPAGGVSASLPAGGEMTGAVIPGITGV